MMILYACSTNPGKLKEFALAARQSGASHVDIQSLPGLQTVRAPEETGATFEENAAIKAAYYSRLTDQFVFTDDSGLEVDSLGGEPGIYSARYAGPSATDAANNELLLDRLQAVMNRHARFVCAIALAKAGKLITTVHGSVEGEIVDVPRGTDGFGYDPLFFYAPLGCTFAELAPEEKLAVSHRGKALRALFAWLSEHEK